MSSPNAYYRCTRCGRIRVINFGALAADVEQALMDECHAAGCPSTPEFCVPGQ